MELFDTLLTENSYPPDGLTRVQRLDARADMAHVLAQFLGECTYRPDMEILLGLLTSFCRHADKKKSLQRLERMAKQLGVADFKRIQNIGETLDNLFKRKPFAEYWVPVDQLSAENPHFQFIDEQVETVLLAMGEDRQAPVKINLGMLQHVDGPYGFPCRPDLAIQYPLGDHLKFSVYFDDYNLNFRFFSFVVQFGQRDKDGHSLLRALDPANIIDRDNHDPAAGVLVPTFEHAWQFVCLLVGRLNVSNVSLSFAEDVYVY